MQKIIASYVFASNVLFISAQDIIKTAVDSATEANGNIYTFVEEMPKYIGEDKEVAKFVKNNLRYPEMERDNHVEGKVFIRFVIEPDGTITGVKVMKSVSPGLDKEAVRVVRLLKFSPGSQQGEPVRVYYNLPIEFKL